MKNSYNINLILKNITIYNIKIECVRHQNYEPNFTKWMFNLTKKRLKQDMCIVRVTFILFSVSDYLQLYLSVVLLRLDHSSLRDNWSMPNFRRIVGIAVLLRLFVFDSMVFGPVRQPDTTSAASFSTPDTCQISNSKSRVIKPTILYQP